MLIHMKPLITYFIVSLIKNVNLHISRQMILGSVGVLIAFIKWKISDDLIKKIRRWTLKRSAQERNVM
jgi:hypothetical protein